MHRIMHRIIRIMHRMAFQVYTAIKSNSVHSRIAAVSQLYLIIEET